MPRPKHPLLGRIRDRIEAEYAKNPEYTFTVVDFYDIAVTPEQRHIMRTDFCKRSSGKPGRSNTLRVVGRIKNAPHSIVNVYQVISVPLVNLTTTRKTGMRKEYIRKRPEDGMYKRRHQPTPAYVMELQSILFWMRGASA